LFTFFAFKSKIMDVKLKNLNKLYKNAKINGMKDFDEIILSKNMKV